MLKFLECIIMGGLAVFFGVGMIFVFLGTGNYVFLAPVVLVVLFLFYLDKKVQEIQ